jgi:hypothetical protein
MTVLARGLLCLALIGAPIIAMPAHAQIAAESGNEDIVVTARLSGAPMWTIQTDHGVVILVGDLVKVPKATPWRPERLQGAAARSQRVILGVKVSVSVGDIFRMLFRMGKLTKLPKGKVAADYLDPALLARLGALEARYRQDYSRKNFLMTAYDLLSKRLAFDHDTTDEASEVVRKAAGKANVPFRPVGLMRGDDMLDNLFAAAPESHIPCLEAAIAAAESGPEIIAERGRAWSQFEIPAVMANPLETALGQCWPWNGDGFGAELRQQWVDAITDASRQQGVTLAVVPLRVLAENGGVLDMLQRRNFAIKGPAWR